MYLAPGLAAEKRCFLAVWIPFGGVTPGHVRPVQLLLPGPARVADLAALGGSFRLGPLAHPGQEPQVELLGLRLPGAIPIRKDSGEIRPRARDVGLSLVDLVDEPSVQARQLCDDLGRVLPPLDLQGGDPGPCSWGCPREVGRSRCYSSRGTSGPIPGTAPRSRGCVCPGRAGNRPQIGRASCRE